MYLGKVLLITVVTYVNTRVYGNNIYVYFRNSYILMSQENITITIEDPLLGNVLALKS